ncbi:hypothetical protein AB0I16_35560 [Streptomyces sp. NPDC050703]|uniref:hypothetical protein n=1 Tax=Streptomyces sp. NPDC050703 TaxID=3157218 RepID=UPI00343EBC67
MYAFKRIETGKRTVIISVFEGMSEIEHYGCDPLGVLNPDATVTDLTVELGEGRSVKFERISIPGPKRRR